MKLCHGCVQVFGKTMLCKDLTVATQVMRQAHMDSVTISGDQVSKRGTFKGGYQDASRCVARRVPILLWCMSPPALLMRSRQA